MVLGFRRSLCVKVLTTENCLTLQTATQLPPSKGKQELRVTELVLGHALRDVNKNLKKSAGSSYGTSTKSVLKPPQTLCGGGGFLALLT